MARQSHVGPHDLISLLNPISGIHFYNIHSLNHNLEYEQPVFVFVRII